jgi:hypothetical protein
LEKNRGQRVTRDARFRLEICIQLGRVSSLCLRLTRMCSTGSAGPGPDPAPGGVGSSAFESSCRVRQRECAAKTSGWKGKGRVRVSVVAGHAADEPQSPSKLLCCVVAVGLEADLTVGRSPCLFSFQPDASCHTLNVAGVFVGDKHIWNGRRVSDRHHVPFQLKHALLLAAATTRRRTRTVYDPVE